MFGTGNKWDKWHGIFAVIITVCLTLAIFLIFEKTEMAFKVGLLISSLLVFALQGVNEALQLQSQKEIERHGGYERFAKNSKRDWAFMVMGWMFGMFLLIFFIGFLV